MKNKELKPEEVPFTPRAEYRLKTGDESAIPIHPYITWLTEELRKCRQATLTEAEARGIVKPYSKTLRLFPPQQMLYESDVITLLMHYSRPDRLERVRREENSRIRARCFTDSPIGKVCRLCNVVCSWNKLRELEGLFPHGENAYGEPCAFTHIFFNPPVSNDEAQSQTTKG